MKKILLCLTLIATPPLFAETGQQRMEKNKSILQKIKESDLEVNLEVLDDYYEQLKGKTKVADMPATDTLKRVIKKTVVRDEVSEKGSQPIHTIKVNVDMEDKQSTRTTKRNAELDALFSKAKQKNKQAEIKSFQPSSRFSGRDPFSITEEMIKGDANLQASLDFLPNEQAKFTVPVMVMKGLVMAEDGQYMAVLDIEGYGIKVVRKGDTIGLQGSGDAAIRIKEITRLQIIVEAGKIGKVIVVR